MKRLIIVGSPRTKGRSARLAEMLFEANIDEHPEDELFLVPVSEVEIGPCIGCNACRAKSGVIVKDEDGHEVTLQKHRCVFDDDMQTVYDLLDDVDEVTVVSPVYFSGAPAPLKCVLDRLQPYFWARVEARESGPLPEKRPLTLHVLGEGGDPHGYDALVSEVRSSFAAADFRLERVLDWVGKVDESGEITAEATVKELPVQPTSAARATGGGAVAAVCDGPGERPAGPAGEASERNRGGAVGAARDAEAAETSRAQKPVKPRPKLDLHSGIKDASEEAARKNPKGDSRASGPRAESKKQGGAQAKSQSRSGGKRKAPGKAPGGASANAKAGARKQGKRRGK